jgi:hypothetical protein
MGCNKPFITRNISLAEQVQDEPKLPKGPWRLGGGNRGYLKDSNNNLFLHLSVVPEFEENCEKIRIFLSKSWEMARELERCVEIIRCGYANQDWERIDKLLKDAGWTKEADNG